MGKKQKKPGKGKEKTERKTAKGEEKRARREAGKVGEEDDIDAILVSILFFSVYFDQLAFQCFTLCCCCCCLLRSVQLLLCIC